MIDGSEKRNRQLAFELPNSHVCEKGSNYCLVFMVLRIRNEIGFLPQSIKRSISNLHRAAGMVSSSKVLAEEL